MQRRWLVLLSLTQRAYSLVPPVKLTDLVVEVDFWTHFSDCFTRDDDPTKGVKERDVLYLAILADAINLGLLQMAQVTPGMSLNQLAWMSDYYLREETYQKALSEIVNFHHRFPFSSYWGEGKTASAVDQLQLFSRQNTHSYLQINDYEKASAEKPGNGPSAGCRQRRVALSAAYTRPGRSRCPDPGDLQSRTAGAPGS